MKLDLKKLYRPRILIVLFIGLVIILWGMSHRHLNRRQHTPENLMYMDADFHLKGVTLQEFQRERLVWRIVTEDARIFRKNDTAFLKSVLLTFHQEDGNVITLTGDNGSIRLSSMDISLKGDILVKSDDGTRLFAESLDWDNKKRLATTDDPVRIIRDNIQIEGIGLELDPDSQVLFIKKRVRTVVDKPGRI